LAAEAFPGFGCDPAPGFGFLLRACQVVCVDELVVPAFVAQKLGAADYHLFMLLLSPPMFSSPIASVAAVISHAQVNLAASESSRSCSGVSSLMAPS
jgi:hypothetical protein